MGGEKFTLRVKVRRSCYGLLILLAQGLFSISCVGLVSSSGDDVAGQDGGLLRGSSLRMCW